MVRFGDLALLIGLGTIAGAQVAVSVGFNFNAVAFTDSHTTGPQLCDKGCIEPMPAAPGVVTLGEIEVIAFLQGGVAPDWLHFYRGGVALTRAITDPVANARANGVVTTPLELITDQGVMDLHQPLPDARPARDLPASYAVAKGDSLRSIAQDLYGDGDQFLRFFEANRDQLATPDTVRAGQVLRVPPI